MFFSQGAPRTAHQRCPRSPDRNGLLRTRLRRRRCQRRPHQPRSCRRPSRASSPSRSPEDRGEARLEQTLKQLGTTASIMMIVAHPDDEDGALLTYLSRGMGVRATLFTLTRGEGGQNEMSGELYDALGIIRTNELLKADEYYGAKQLWGTEVDFGFSKTQEESFQNGPTTASSMTQSSPSAANVRRSSSPPLSAASPTATASTRSPAKSPRRSSTPPPIPRSSPISSSPSPKEALGSSPGNPSPSTP